MKDIKAKKGEIGKFIEEILKKNDTLTLATVGEGSPWASTLIYAFDKNFNLYFISDKASRHSKELKKNPVVAAAIHDKDGEMRGLQIQGRASVAPKFKAPMALKLFWQRFPWAKEWVSSPRQLLKKTFKDALYVVRPQKIFLLDKEKFGSEVRKIFEI